MMDHDEPSGCRRSQDPGGPRRRPEERGDLAGAWWGQEGPGDEEESAGASRR